MTPPDTRHGHNAYDAVSALQKAIRRSQPEAAAYWAVELTLAGLGPWALARLVVIAIEDVDPRATGLVADVRALREQFLADRKDPMPVVAAAVKLAIAPKSRLVAWLTVALADESCPKRDVADEALDRHTARGRAMGRGMEHFLAEAQKLVQWDDGEYAELEAEAERRRRAVGQGTTRKPPPPDPQLTLTDEEER